MGRWDLNAFICVVRNPMSSIYISTVKIFALCLWNGVWREREREEENYRDKHKKKHSFQHGLSGCIRAFYKTYSCWTIYLESVPEQHDRPENLFPLHWIIGFEMWKIHRMVNFYRTGNTNDAAPECQWISVDITNTTMHANATVLAAHRR